jgi:hypothetical protein
MNDSEKRDDMLAANMPSAPCAEGRGFSSRKGLPLSPGRPRGVLAGMFSTLDSHLAPVHPPETVWKDRPRSAAKSLAKAGLLGWMVAAGLAAVTVVTWYSTRTPELAPLMVLNDAQQHGQWIVSADSRRQYLSIAPLRPNAVAAQTACSFGLFLPGRPDIHGLLQSIPTHVALRNNTHP